MNYFEEANDVLKEVHHLIRIGSSNIRPISFNDHPLVDTISTAPELNAIQKIKNRKLDALLDINVTQLAFDKIEHYRDIAEAFEYERDLEGLYYFLHARIAQQLGAGNCMEMVLIAMTLLHMRCPDLSMHYVYFENYDHDFLILNLPSKASIKDWRTWGDAIVMDPWLNVAFSAEDFLISWKKNLSFLEKENDAEVVKKEDSTVMLPGFIAIKLLMDNKKLFRLMKPYLALFGDPKWPIRLVHLLRGNVAKRFIQIYDNDLQQFSRDARLFSAEDFSKVMNVCNAKDAQFFCRQIWKNLYAKEYQSQSANLMQKILYMLTTTDIKSIEIESIRSGIGSASNLSTDLRENILIMLNVIEIAQKYPLSFNEKVLAFKEITRLNFNAYLNLQGMTDFVKLRLDGEFLHRAYFGYLNLSSAALHNCKLQDSNGLHSNLSHSHLLNCDFARSDLSDVDFTGAELIGCDFSGANLSGAILVDTRLVTSNFELADLTKAIFIPKHAFNDLGRLDAHLEQLYLQVNGHQDEELLTSAIAENIIKACKKIFKTDKDLALKILDKSIHHLLFYETAAQTVSRKRVSLFEAKHRPAEMAYKKLLSYQEVLSAKIKGEPSAPTI